MIVYHHNNEIDREQWDNCIKATTYARPYAYSWYLDIMAPGWQALVDDDYDSVFPVPGSRRFGINYISTPSFLQQLGAFSPDKPEQTALKEFLDYMPDFYRYIDLCVGQKIISDGYRIYEKINLELDLSHSYDTLFNSFSETCKCGIGLAARSKPEIVTDIKPDELINHFIENNASEMNGIGEKDMTRLRNLVNFCVINKKGKILGVRGTKKKLLTGMFLIEVRGRITVLFVSSNPKACEKGIDYFVVSEMIRTHANSRTILDFSDSSNPHATSFFSSFGCSVVPYYRIYRNSLFWPLSMIR